MLASDANGLPLGMLTMSAGVGEVRMAEATLATISVPQKKGKPKSRPPATDCGQGLRQPEVPPVAARTGYSPLHPAEVSLAALLR